MVWHRANRPQWYIKTLKEATMEAMKLRTLGAMELIIKKAKAKLKILKEEDV